MSGTDRAASEAGIKHSHVGPKRGFAPLRMGFTIAPIVFGLDKFADLLAGWGRHLAPWIGDILPGGPHQATLTVGVIEVLAGIAVAIVPRFVGERAQLVVDPVLDLLRDALTRLLA